MPVLALPKPLTARSPVSADHELITTAIPLWWKGVLPPAEAESLLHMIKPAFIEQFAETSLIISNKHSVSNKHSISGEHSIAANDELVAFMLAGLSRSRADQAFIHLVGINPEYRSAGLGRILYEWFFSTAAAAGRTTVHSMTWNDNQRSIDFHRAMGFTVDEHNDNERRMIEFLRPIGD